MKKQLQPPTDSNANTAADQTRGDMNRSLTVISRSEKDYLQVDVRVEQPVRLFVV